MIESVTLSLPIQAALWGGFTGIALLLGANFGYFVNLSQKVISTIMAFGVGVLISALSIDLMLESSNIGGVSSASLGFLAGVLLYSSANKALAIFGAKHRKRSHKSDEDQSNGGAIALGALLDGIPEAAAIGVSLLQGKGVAVAAVIAIFISNIPEGLSSSVGMKKDGKSKCYIFLLWGGMILVTSFSAWCGYTFLGMLSPQLMGATLAVASGAIFVMIIETMIPEAFEKLHGLTGPIAALGFLVSFFINQIF